MFLRAVLTAVLSIVSTQASAFLTWDTQVFKYDAAPADTEVRVRFPFVNNGRRTVEITSIDSGCGCTTVDLEKRVYQPGEGGTLEAVFVFGDREGSQHKVVTVMESDGEDVVTRQLEMFVTIPKSISMRPYLQYWKVGEAAAPRPFIIQLADNYHGVPVSVRMYSEQSDFRLGELRRTGEHGFEFDALPLSTDLPTTEAGEIVFEVPGGQPRAIMFYLSVR
jgi:hypothetical protein